MIKKGIIFIISLGIFLPGLVLAQEAFTEFPDDYELPATPIVYQNEYRKGKVIEVLDEGELDIAGYIQPYQNVKIEVTNGNDKGVTFDQEYQLSANNFDKQKFEVGDKVIVVKAFQGDDVEYYIAEPYRIPALIWILLAFIAIAVITAKKKGARSLLGLLFSLLIIVEFILPRIAEGGNPLVIAVIGSIFIMIVSLYLAHGFNKRTHIALAGTTITLLISAILSVIVVNAANLFGLGSEEAVSLLQGRLAGINFQGLLLGGIIIGALGVLDDITTAQSATVEELHKANPKLSAKELFNRAFSVGREHITSLINTLALAYVGASLPLMLIFYENQFPLWVLFNSEFLVEEIMRTLVGSIALILAVPITTYLASKFFENDPVDPNDQQDVIPHIH